jgi:hypothetical protein
VLTGVGELGWGTQEPNDSAQGPTTGVAHRLDSAGCSKAEKEGVTWEAEHHGHPLTAALLPRVMSREGMEL